jgi:phenylalanine-4-hydroxylase
MGRMMNNNNLSDEDLKRRQKDIISQAAGQNKPPAKIHYLPHEHKIWQLISQKLLPIWDRKVADEVLEARATLQLPLNNVPQLSDVSEKLIPLTGFEYRSVGGLAPINIFFGGLANKKFLSTQYLRHPANPFYTEQPDIVHEVIGHGTLLADSRFAELHQLTGETINRLASNKAKKIIADIWWFTGEFGLLNSPNGVKAFGAGILSSVNELNCFTKNAKLMPLEIADMIKTSYSIDKPQDVLFVAESVDHVLETLKKFFESATDEELDNLQ